MPAPTAARSRRPHPRRLRRWVDVVPVERVALWPEPDALEHAQEQRRIPDGQALPVLGGCVRPDSVPSAAAQRWILGARRSGDSLDGEWFAGHPCCERLCHGNTGEPVAEDRKPVESARPAATRGSEVVPLPHLSARLALAGRARIGRCRTVTSASRCCRPSDSSTARFGPCHSVTSGAEYDWRHA